MFNYKKIRMKILIFFANNYIGGENMYEDIESLKNKFYEISNLGWVKNISNGKGSVGITLEKLLNINSNEFEVPDYEMMIELKSKSKYFNNKYPVSLFSATCDGESFYELRRIKDKYGLPIKEYNNRILFVNLYANKYSNIGKFYKGKLLIDYFSHKIYFVILNKKNQIIDKHAFWSFETLEEKLNRKLKFIAFVEADRKIVNNTLFFYYKKISIYKMKEFNTFINLLYDGTISINIKIGIYKDGPRVGQTHDHGTSFQIFLSDFEKLFTKI